jgi:penicillin-binding protein 2
MPKHADDPRMVTRRGFFLGGLMFAAFSTLAGRLFYLQFVRREEFATQAADNSIKIQLVAPVRGRILDANGTVLAGNEKNFRLFMEATSPRDLRKALQKLSPILPMDGARIDAVIESARATNFRLPVMVKEHLSWDDLARFEFASPRYSGLFVDVGLVRSYPLKEQASHLVGYVGAPAPEEMEEDQDALMRLPDFRIGKSGVEKMLEPRLRGTPGVKHIEVNVHNVPVRELSSQEGVPGEDVRLTVDARLQAFTAARLAPESASAVVMDVHNGDVLALASVPSFDSNRFSLGITRDYWKELQADEKNPLLNKAIAGQYPPGSTFKLMTGTAALQYGAVSPNERVFCPGHFMLGNHQFDCWKTRGHGYMDLHDALAQSCDTYFYTMAQRLGIDKIAATCLKFGLGRLLNLGIVGEKPGIVPDEKWKRARFNQQWNPGDTINAGIGQGYVLATPLQLCVMTARLVNGGFAVLPRLTRSGQEKPAPPIDISADHLRWILNGMQAVCNEPRGTAFSMRIKDEDFAMGGKTGTAQVRKLIAHNLNQNSLPWEDRHHALFVGYAPVAAPRYACAVVVEHGGGGASAAAPVARDILQKIQELRAARDPYSGVS